MEPDRKYIGDDVYRSKDAPQTRRLSYEGISKLDHVSLAALIRQRAHWVDNWPLRLNLAPPNSLAARKCRAYWNVTLKVLRPALKVWEERGYDMNRPYIKFAIDALKRGEELEKTKVYQESPPTKPLPSIEIEVLERVIRERRSIRLFTDEDVPDKLVDRVVDAARWAPCACCIQGYRFIVLREKKLREMIGQPWNAPVVIIVATDERPYQFIKQALPHNAYFDVGAAVQNMLLMAHALGLGAVWGTFGGERKRLDRALHLPDYAKLMTYVVLGWPADNPKFVPKIDLDECVSRDGWFFEEGA